ncbi:MAG: tRNA lysidine(34) synthetase TilS [Emergencia sp.]
MKQVKKTIEEHNLIRDNQHIVLGLSGGPDSVCLFYCLMELAEEMNLTIHPVHVNHKFRPGAAERDQAYVEKLCADNNLECRSFVVDCRAIADEEGITSEEAGRKVRYEAFSKVAGEICSSGAAKDDIRIAVAQNADDQAETVLFRILRGTGVDGLAGISYERTDEEGYRIVRPLLDVTKAQVLEYCREKGLEPCMDHTNSQPIYTRNRIRLELIPYLEKEYNSNIKDTIIRMGKAAAADSDYIWAQAEKTYREMVKSETESCVLLDGEKLKDCHRAVRRRVISLALKKIGLTEDISYAHFEGCESIMESSSPSARTDLPKGYYAARNYGDFKLCRREDEKSSSGICLRVKIMDARELDRNRVKDSEKRNAVFDYDHMCEALGTGCEKRIVLGCREAGDYLPLGGDKRKKLQDYFIDRKIPKDERDRVKLVKIGHEVLWILPWNDKGRFCGNYKLDDDTKKVICIETFCDL